MTRPNIVLMVADDHGREALGCYGNPAVATPHLDRLANDGVRFTHAFCTTASCAASRSVILTGLHNHTNGTYGHTHGCHHFACFDHVRTLPALMAEAGYRTGRVGKRHYAPERLFPFQWEKPEGQFGRDDVAMSEACREFVSAGGPFFLYWCSHNPHRAARLDRHPLQPNGFGNPAAAFPGDVEQTFRDEDVIVPPYLSDTPATRAELAQYYQSIARLDRGIGRLIDVLKQTGQYDNTVILYLSDNGAAFPGAKTTLYDPGMRLPCIVADPQQPVRGTTCDGLITWADITPTVLDYAGAATDRRTFHGASFRRIVPDAHPDGWRDAIHAAHTFHEITNYYPMRVVRTHRHAFLWNIAWKLDYSFASDLWEAASWQSVPKQPGARLGQRTVEAYLRRPRLELYDLQADPHETVNLADQPGYAGLVDDFCRRIRAFQAETADPWLHKWEYE